MISLLLCSLLALIYTNDIFTAYVFVEINTITSCAIVMLKKSKQTLIKPVHQSPNVFSVLADERSPLGDHPASHGGFRALGVDGGWYSQVIPRDGLSQSGPGRAEPQRTGHLGGASRERYAYFWIETDVFWTNSVYSVLHCELQLMYFQKTGSWQKYSRGALFNQIFSRLCLQMFWAFQIVMINIDFRWTKIQQKKLKNNDYSAVMLPHRKHWQAPINRKPSDVVFCVIAPINKNTCCFAKFQYTPWRIFLMGSLTDCFCL